MSLFDLIIEKGTYASQPFARCFKLVRPDPKNFPALSSKISTYLSVSLSIFFYFIHPELAGEFAPPSWKLPAVPEIAVYEDCFFGGRNGYVRATLSSGVMSAKLHALLDEFFEDKNFQLRIFPSYLGHDLTPLCFGKDVSGLASHSFSGFVENRI